MKERTNSVVLIVFLLLCPLTAYAYIGPGLGLGAIGAVLGILGAIILGMFAILYYPVKRYFKRRKNAQAPKNSEKQESEILVSNTEQTSTNSKPDLNKREEKPDQ